MSHVEINLKNGGCLVFPKDKLYLANFIVNDKNMEKTHKYMACSVIDEEEYWDITETEYKCLKHILRGK